MTINQAQRNKLKALAAIAKALTPDEAQEDTAYEQNFSGTSEDQPEFDHQPRQKSDIYTKPFLFKEKSK